jgi:hypothetical protein
MHIIDSFECPGISPWHIAVDSHKIWVFDEYDDNIIQVSKQTGQEEKKLFSLKPGDDHFNCHGLASDGRYLYSSDHRKIARILINDPLDIQVVNTPDIDPSAICFDGEYFRVIDFLHVRVHKLSVGGELISSYENYGLGHGIAFDGFSTLTLQPSPDLLLKYNENGDLLEAHILPKSSQMLVAYRDLAFDGEHYWVLVNHYSADLPSIDYIYKLGYE